jgi:hypothetical protein
LGSVATELGRVAMELGSGFCQELGVYSTNGVKKLNLTQNARRRKKIQL